MLIKSYNSSLRVVILRTSVGILTGPFVLDLLSFDLWSNLTQNVKILNKNDLSVPICHFACLIDGTVFAGIN